MKLAEALALKGRLNTKMTELKGRMQGSLTVEEGSTPVDSFDAVAQSYDDAARELRELDQRILLTNQTATLVHESREGQTLASALVDRADIGRRRAFHRAAADGARQATNTRYRFRAQELRTEVLIDVEVQDAIVEELDAAWTDLDAAIQATNWATNLAELN
jgi:hypothetical protein